jgi:hypothetical protein
VRNILLVDSGSLDSVQDDEQIKNLKITDLIRAFYDSLGDNAARNAKALFLEGHLYSEDMDGSSIYNLSKVPLKHLSYMITCVLNSLLGTNTEAKNITYKLSVCQFLKSLFDIYAEVYINLNTVVKSPNNSNSDKENKTFNKWLENIANVLGIEQKEEYVYVAKKDIYTNTNLTVRPTIISYTNSNNNGFSAMLQTITNKSDDIHNSIIRDLSEVQGLYLTIISTLLNRGILRTSSATGKRLIPLFYDLSAIQEGSAEISKLDVKVRKQKSSKVESGFIENGVMENDRKRLIHGTIENAFGTTTSIPFRSYGGFDVKADSLFRATSGFHIIKNKVRLTTEDIKKITDLLLASKYNDTFSNIFTRYKSKFTESSKNLRSNRYEELAIIKMVKHLAYVQSILVKAAVISKSPSTLNAHLQEFKGSNLYNICASYDGVAYLSDKYVFDYYSACVATPHARADARVARADAAVVALAARGDRADAAAVAVARDEAAAARDDLAAFANIEQLDISSKRAAILKLSEIYNADVNTIEFYSYLESDDLENIDAIITNSNVQSASFLNQSD